MLDRLQVVGYGPPEPILVLWIADPPPGRSSACLGPLNDDEDLSLGGNIHTSVIGARALP